MADTNTTKQEAQSNAVYEPFSWLTAEAQEFPQARFVENTKDIAQGIALVLEMVEVATLERDEGVNTPILGAPDCATLTRFAIAAARNLHELAEDRVGWLNNHGAKHVRKGTISGCRG